MHRRLLIFDGIVVFKVEEIRFIDGTLGSSSIHLLITSIALAATSITSTVVVNISLSNGAIKQALSMTVLDAIVSVQNMRQHWKIYRKNKTINISHNCKHHENMSAGRMLCPQGSLGTLRKGSFKLWLDRESGKICLFVISSNLFTEYRWNRLYIHWRSLKHSQTINYDAIIPPSHWRRGATVVLVRH